MIIVTFLLEQQNEEKEESVSVCVFVGASVYEH